MPPAPSGRAPQPPGLGRGSSTGCWRSRAIAGTGAAARTRGRTAPASLSAGALLPAAAPGSGQLGGDDAAGSESLQPALRAKPPCPVPSRRAAASAPGLEAVRGSAAPEQDGDNIQRGQSSVTGCGSSHVRQNRRAPERGRTQPGSVPDPRTAAADRPPAAAADPPAEGRRPELRPGAAELSAPSSRRAEVTIAQQQPPPRLPREPKRESSPCSPTATAGSPEGSAGAELPCPRRAQGPRELPRPPRAAPAATASRDPPPASPRAHSCGWSVALEWLGTNVLLHLRGETKTRTQEGGERGKSLGNPKWGLKASLRSTSTSRSCSRPTAPQAGRSESAEEMSLGSSNHNICLFPPPAGMALQTVSHPVCPPARSQGSPAATGMVSHPVSAAAHPANTAACADRQTDRASLQQPGASFSHLTPSSLSSSLGRGKEGGQQPTCILLHTLLNEEEYLIRRELEEHTITLLLSLPRSLRLRSARSRYKRPILSQTSSSGATRCTTAAAVGQGAGWSVASTSSARERGHGNTPSRAVHPLARSHSPPPRGRDQRSTGRKELGQSQPSSGGLSSPRQDQWG